MAATTHPTAMLGMWAKWQIRVQSKSSTSKVRTHDLRRGTRTHHCTPSTDTLTSKTRHSSSRSVPRCPPLPPTRPSSPPRLRHHLRSALNYLVIELAWIDTRGDCATADKRQEFPFAADPTKWREKRVQKVCLRGTPTSATEQ